MQPTPPAHQRGYHQDGWSAVPRHESIRPQTLSPSPNMHTGTSYVPLPPGAPSLPPASSQPPSSQSASMSSVPRLEPWMALAPHQSPPPSSAHAVPSSLRPQSHTAVASSHRPPVATTSAYAAQSPLTPRLVNPYEQTASYAAGPDLTPLQSPSTHEARSRVNFGPGDPLLSARAPAEYFETQPRQQPAPPRRSQHAEIIAGGSRSPLPLSPSVGSAQPASSSDRMGNSRASTASHSAPGHDFDDCPGCRAELEDAIQASLQTAKQEEARRRDLREPSEHHELERIYALTAEEEQRQRQIAIEEEALLLQAINDSCRDAELQQRRHVNDEDVLLEESRQHALRQRDQDAAEESAMLEAAKKASEAHERQRLQRLESLRDAEQKALQLSLQEQEEEWARRESAERSLLEFLEYRGQHHDPADRLSTPLRSVSSSPAPDLGKTSSAAASSSHGDLEAEYWRFSGHDQAYQLALQMQQASLEERNDVSQLAPSGSRSRRPLPQTPTLHNDSTGSNIRSGDADHVHNFGLEAGRPEVVDGADTNPDQLLQRPVLQQRSSSSSSNQSPPVALPPADGLYSPSKPLPNPYDTHRTSADSAGSSSNTPYPDSESPSVPKRASSQFSITTRETSDATSSTTHEQKGQRALAGIDFGYSSLPFAPKLDKGGQPSPAQSSPSLSTSSHSTSVSGHKARFPASIVLSAATKAGQASELDAAGLLQSAGDGMSGSFFVIRAHSWKSLLRTLAWYGNSRVEASPEDVATASERRSGRCLLRAEVEFVTPIRVDLGLGVGEYAKAARTPAGMPKTPSPAHVALCLSLLPLSASTSSSSSDGAGAWLKSDAYQTIKRESRRLDAWYAGRGSTRRLIQLSRKPPALPVALVQVAQLLHASHAFSAACPSSGSTARHSPRDLHHAIERHDEGFVRKQKAMLVAASTLASSANTPGTPSNASLTSSAPRFSTSGPTRYSGSSELHREEDELEHGNDDDQDVDVEDFHVLEHGLAGDGSFDAQDKVLMGKRHRLKAKVKRRLAKRNADGRVVDEDLAAWITPFDLSQHG